MKVSVSIFQLHALLCYCYPNACHMIPEYYKVWPCTIKLWLFECMHLLKSIFFFSSYLEPKNVNFCSLLLITMHQYQPWGSFGFQVFFKEKKREINCNAQLISLRIMPWLSFLLCHWDIWSRWIPRVSLHYLWQIFSIGLVTEWSICFLCWCQLHLDHCKDNLSYPLLHFANCQW